MQTYAVRGTYPDGITRHHHVSLSSDILIYASRLLTGILPFAKVEVRRCETFLCCSHHAGGADWS